MTPETLKALKGSIEKWRRIVEGTGWDYGPRNCPLCIMFRDWDDDGVNSCGGCPVKERTGKDGCEDTPYEAYVDAEGTIGEKAAARAELDFLRSLLPKEEAPWQPLFSAP